MWRLWSLLKLVCALQHELDSVAQLDFALWRNSCKASLSLRMVCSTSPHGHLRDSDWLLLIFNFFYSLYFLSKVDVASEQLEVLFLLLQL